MLGLVSTMYNAIYFYGYAKYVVYPQRPLRSYKWYEKYAVSMKTKSLIYSFFMCDSLYNRIPVCGVCGLAPQGPAEQQMVSKVCRQYETQISDLLIFYV